MEKQNSMESKLNFDVESSSLELEFGRKNIQKTLSGNSNSEIFRQNDESIFKNGQIKKESVVKNENFGSTSEIGTNLHLKEEIKIKVENISIANEPIIGESKSIKLEIKAENEHFDASEYELQYDNNFSHYSTNLYSCMYCSEKFNCKEALKKHQTSCDNKKKYHCHICQRRFVLKTNLTSHLFGHNEHNEQESFSCEICKKKFYQKENLAQHILLIHSNGANYACGICFKKFKSKEALKQHLMVNNDKKKLCSKNPSQKSKYSLGDDNDTNFSCKKCQKEFKWKVSFDIHMKTHSDDNPFTCPICFKGFKRKDNLYLHKKHSHNNEKNFSCTVCTKTFLNETNLMLHSYIHQKDVKFGDNSKNSAITRKKSKDGLRNSEEHTLTDIKSTISTAQIQPLEDDNLNINYEIKDISIENKTKGCKNESDNLNLGNDIKQESFDALE